jgi:hypothetical protein
MKKALVALLLLACFPLVHAQIEPGWAPPKAKPGVDYPVKVHITGIRVRLARDREPELRADASLNQQKVELTGNIAYGPRYFYDPRNAQDRLMPGDYTARLLKSAHKGAPGLLYDEYELRLPDQTIWRCWVSGIFE